MHIIIFCEYFKREPVTVNKIEQNNTVSNKNSNTIYVSKIGINSH